MPENAVAALEIRELVDSLEGCDPDLHNVVSAERNSFLTNALIVRFVSSNKGVSKQKMCKARDIEARVYGKGSRYK